MHSNLTMKQLLVTIARLRTNLLNRSLYEVTILANIKLLHSTDMIRIRLKLFTIQTIQLKQTAHSHGLGKNFITCPCTA